MIRRSASFARRRPQTSRGGRPRASKAAQTAPVEAVRIPGGGWHIRIGLKLQSPNQKSGHPMAQHAERLDWTVAIRNALIVAIDVRTADQVRALDAPAPSIPMQLRLTREGPSERHFITDPDNLWYAAKRLVDAMKANHLFYDDSSTWLHRLPPAQRVSLDGQYWVDLELTPL